MAEHEASRTLVKSAPELWAECSDAASLARHLGRFGEIRITKLEPETAIAWEGDDVRGTVTLEPSGWGTRVTLTASADASPASEPDSTPEAESEPEDEFQEPEDEPVMQEPSESAPTQSFLARLLGRWRREIPAVEPDDGDASDRESPTPEPASAEATPNGGEGRSRAPARELAPQASALVEALESLGSAHRRPFSRG